MLRIIYVCSFSLVGHAGHKRATRHKLEALAEVSDLHVLSSRFENKLLRVLELPLLELRAILWILVQRPNVIISRGGVGGVFQLVARMLGTFTVREVHANASEEVAMQGRGASLRAILRVSAWLSDVADCSCEMRIFNNPLLMQWFHAKYGWCDNDVYVYNGYRPSSASAIERSSAREGLGLDLDGTYLAFTGSASEWHGIEYLVALQEEFDAEGDGIRIVCGGGKVPACLDPNRRLLNISPLDDAGCARLIRAANLSLLPVKQNRVSPGSPLKLYDYIVNKSWVVTQECLAGYSDEVLRYGVGVSIDFRDSMSARSRILEVLPQFASTSAYPCVDASWRKRMFEWLTSLDQGLARRGASK